MIKKIIGNDNIIKIGSLLAAVVLWMFVVSVNNPVVEIPVNGIPIEIINTDNLESNSLNVVNMSQEKTNVKIKGRMSDVAKIKAENIKVFVDASKIYSANTYYLETKSEINSSTVTVSHIDVSEVNVFVDYIFAVEKKIEVVTVGQPKEGYTLNKAVPSFESVVIKGPQSLINKVSSVKAIVDITDVSDDFSKVYPVKMYTVNNEEVITNYVTMTVQDVNISVSLNYSKTVGIELPEEFNSPDYEVKIQPESVTVSGDANVLKDIEKIILSDFSYTPNESNSAETIEWSLPATEGVKYGENENKVIITIKKINQ